MKSLIALLRWVLIDLGTRCGTSTTLDLKTIERRVEHEGISFLTISLANFGSDFQKSLDQGYVDSCSFAGFQRKGGLPLFLGGFLSHVFSTTGGRLLDEPCISCILSIRQITLMWAKMSIPCSETRTKKAIAQYVKCESSVRQYDVSFSNDSDLIQTRFKRMSSLLWADYFSKLDNSLYAEGIVPKHGPGATADKLRGNAKFRQIEWTERLQKVFPDWENLIPNGHFSDDLHSVTVLEPGMERPVRVITVPKTLKTPRIIAIEPACMQYAQQGVLEMMTKIGREFDNFRSFVCSDSQAPNQKLARFGSTSGSLATLDLSEASDRVSNQHVRALLANHRHLFDAVDATRSRKADVPGFGVQRLAKFASMGSALCFPFEAIVFTTVIFMGIERALNRRLTAKDISNFAGKVRVYGDDIIVPVEFVHTVIEELEAFGFLVNTHKSFWTGKFRESCGKDYYSGIDVSVVRCRSFLPRNKQHVKEIISTVSLRNQLYAAGFDRSVEYLDSLILGIIPFPYVSEASSLLGRHGPGLCQPERHDEHLHQPLVKGMMVFSPLPSSKLEDGGALLKWFLKRGDEPFDDELHLERAGRPVSVRIKSRWASP